MPLMFGRKPPLYNHRTFRSGLALAASLDKLGSAPAASRNYTRAVNQAVGGADQWGMLGNDQWGDCVEAWEGHFLMLRTANAGSIVIPTVDDIVALYSDETGFNPNAGPSGANPTDGGTNETSDAAYMVSTGLLGHKADATAMVNPVNLDHVRWCVELFGACELGINVPQSMMDQFQAGEPFTVVADSPTVGGHCIGITRYNGEWAYVSTWGEGQHEATWDWVRSVTEEAHALLFFDWILSQGESLSGFNLAQLITDLGEMA